MQKSQYKRGDKLKNGKIYWSKNIILEPIKYQYYYNKEKIRKSKWRIKNKFKINKYTKEYYQNNINKIKKYNQKYYIKNKLDIHKRNNAWRKKNWSLVKLSYCKNKKENDKKYRLKNKIKISLRRKTLHKEKMKNDIIYRITRNLRSRLKFAVKNGLKNKTSNTLKFLGCSPRYLIKYLESKFKKGMNWNNYGAYWHIDHIIPCSSFDLKKKSNQVKCFSYKNLQPLTKEENLKKYNKILNQNGFNT
jgi:hypothetical protein